MNWFKTLTNKEELWHYNVIYFIRKHPDSNEIVRVNHLIGKPVHMMTLEDIRLEREFFENRPFKLEVLLFKYQH